MKLSRAIPVVSVLLGLAGWAGAAAAQPAWRAPVVITSEPSQVNPPQVAVEDDGGALVAWARGGADPAVWARVRPGADAPFGAPERLSAPWDRAACTMGCGSR